MTAAEIGDLYRRRWHAELDLRSVKVTLGMDVLRCQSPQMVRKEWKNLNGLWQLSFAKEGEEPPVGRELSEQILVPFPVQSALSGVMKPAERVWYRRTFEVPEEWAGKRVLLHFGAVNWESTVWVNGKKLGTHRGGYDGFSFDITGHLKKNGPQELIVGVWNPIDSGDYVVSDSS